MTSKADLAGEAPQDSEGGSGARIGDLLRSLEDHRDRLPAQRKPNIIVCGRTGVGKTTTINALFGREVGRVGYFSRGTEHDELYEWEAHDRFLDIVDLPGLGDSAARDPEFAAMYRRRVAEADGFIIVVAPPRPAEEPTVRTVNLLLRCGVKPESMVFAFNRLTSLTVPIDGVLRAVALNGIAGPATLGDLGAIRMAREAFFADLVAKVRRNGFDRRFRPEQIVPYDAVTGWNLFGVFDAVLQRLPGDSLVSWRGAVERGRRDLEQRTTTRLRRRNEELERLLLAKQKEIEALSSPKGGGAAEKKTSGGGVTGRVRLERERADLLEQQAALKAEEHALRDLSTQQAEHDAAVESKFAVWVSRAATITIEFTKAVARELWRRFTGST